MGKGIAYSKSVFYLCPTLLNHLNFVLLWVKDLS
jgi:hypothetical protein